MLLDSKDKYHKVNFFKSLFLRIYIIIVSIISVSLFINNIITNASAEKYFLVTEIILFLNSFPLIFSGIFDSIFDKKIMKEFAFECLDIIHNTKMPKKQSKVVYVYTIHNDFMPGRLLQTMQQTYKNIEYWISDGSSNKEVINEVNEFVKKNKNVNLYRLPKESKNKADNLNTFLKNVKPQYDFLLISDADEVIHKDFVYSAIRFFYSEKNINLAYISSFNDCYHEKYLFSYATKKRETQTFYKDLFHNFKTRHFPNLYSASCLLSAKFMKDINNVFPEGNYEDFYTEALAVKKQWNSLILPITCSLYQNDQTSRHFFKRILRIYDWKIQWWKKEKPFKWHNEKYQSWFLNGLSCFFKPFYFLIAIILFSVLFYIFWNYWAIIRDQKIFLISVIVQLFCIAFYYSVSTFWWASKINKGFLNNFLYSIFTVLYSLGFVQKMIYHFVKTVFFNKYSEFGGSPKRKIDNRILRANNECLINYLLLFIYAIFLVILNTTFYYLNLINSLLYLFILLNLFFGIFFLSNFSIIILANLSCIVWDKNYDPMKFIYVKNDFLKFKKIKNEYYAKNHVSHKID